MAESGYISREAFRREIDEHRPGRCYEDAWALTILDSLPDADVRPNIPGKWIRENNPSYSPFDDSSEYLYRCSQCEEHNNRESAFCPDCGAQMRGGEQDGV